MEETNERELTDLIGRTVDRVSTDFQLRLLLAGNSREGTETVEVVIKTEFTYRDEDGRDHHLDPDTGHRISLGPALRLFKAEIATASVSSTSQLILGFSDGSRVVVTPDSPYEAWEIVGPGNYLLVCTVGGHLSEYGQA